MVLPLHGHGLRRRDGRLVFRAVEAGHVGVHGPTIADFEDGGFGFGSGDRLGESEGAALGLWVVGDVGGILGVDGGRFENELVGVQCNCCGGGCNGEVDLEVALVGKRTLKVEVGKSESVVGWLDALNPLSSGVVLGAERLTVRGECPYLLRP